VTALAERETAKGLRLVNVSVMISQRQRAERLTPVELRLVRYLAGHEGRFVENWELKDHLYRGVCSGAAIRVHVFNIRAKLGRSFIETGDLGGYRLSSQRAAALERVCARCNRPVVAYREEWVCYGCPSTSVVDLEVGRSHTGGPRAGKPWTEEEREYVLAHYTGMTLEEIGEALSRGPNAVRGELDRMGLSKPYVRRAR
jgi:hypothetical protein